MLLLLSIIKAISEILALTLFGRGVLWLIGGKARENNFVYNLLSAITRPVLRLARLVTPRAVPDRYVWPVAVLIVLVAWVVSSHQKLELCKTEAMDDPLCVEIVKALEERETGSK